MRNIGINNQVGIMKHKPHFKPKKAYSPHYVKRKPFFSEKEIIFRSAGRAKVFQISSRMQMIILGLFLCIALWSFYSSHRYYKSGQILNHKEIELVETRDAYVDLMGDFVAIHKNIDSVLEEIDKKGRASNKDVSKYKRQAMVVEDKIKQITSEKAWADDKKLNQKMEINEALLQRDIAATERDELKQQLKELENSVKAIKAAEMEVFSRVESIASKEIKKIKSAFQQINDSLKERGMYYNPLANSQKKNSRGGPFIPASISDLPDKQIQDKISTIFKAADDLEYYRDVVKYVPIGKPVWSYWVTSKFGYRSDPFNKKKAGHKGIDLASRTGNKIQIKAKGKVVQAVHGNKGYGNYVVVDHGNGFTTKYAHMHKIYVKKGDYLKINDTIGEVGSTGRSTGPHLHYEVLYRGVHVDPMPFMQAKL